MRTIDVTLEPIFRQLTDGNVGLAISELTTYLSAWPNPQSFEKLDAIKADYQLMADYWQKGVADPQQAQQYQQLLQRLYVLSANIAVHRHMVASSYLQVLYQGARQKGRSWSLDAIRHEMENFVSEVAMLELEPEHTRQTKSQDLYKQHQQQMNQLFNYIVTSHIWTDGIGQTMEEMLVAPTVDSIDQQLLVSAVMLSLMNRFDIAKFRLLVNVYRRSMDEQVRQRALVGWVLSLDDDFLNVYPEQRELIAGLLKSKRACQELTELQMQLVYTLNAEKDTATVEKEIMPDLLKNNSLRVTGNGIEEIPEDPLEDVLNPNASEQRMEKLEALFQRMQDMQKRGADIYFGGFSQMKRNPFFYDMSNWFVPFYMQHPDISNFVQKIGNNRFVENVMRRGPFCNSDKYSFVMAFQQVVDHLPESLQQMMKRGEASLDEMEQEEQQSPAFIRRSYLMDLYRFFRLFPNRAALCNPFEITRQQLGMCLFFTSSLFADTPLEESKREVVAMLKKRQMNEFAHQLLDTFPQSMHDIQYYLWTEQYTRAVELEPDNERALAGKARQDFETGLYEEAENEYEHLMLLRPDKPGYMLNRSVCLVKLEEYEDALQLLYRLNYEHPDDLNVCRVLAWTLTCDGKLEQAEKLFHQLMEAEEPTDEDYQNRGYCLWLMGKLTEAADSFRKSIEMAGTDNLFAFIFDKRWLQDRGVSDIDIKMMEAMVKA